MGKMVFDSQTRFLIFLIFIGVSALVGFMGGTYFGAGIMRNTVDTQWEIIKKQKEYMEKQAYYLEKVLLEYHRLRKSLEYPHDFRQNSKQKTYT